MIKTGYAQRDITPDFPHAAGGKVPLAGYGVERFAAGVHDRLYVRALVCTSGAGDPHRVVLLQFDLLNLDRICMEGIYRGLSRFDLGRENLLCCCVHTHSGYGGIFDLQRGLNRAMIPLLGRSSPELAAFTVNRALEALEEALEDCGETQIKINKGTLEGLGTNRHDPLLPCDRDLFIVEFIKSNKKILLYNLSCHPTVMGRENLLISADFAGAAAAFLGEQGYEGVIFINGSAGDMSTRFTRKESSFEECERLGRLAGQAVWDLAQEAGSPVSLENISLEYRTFFLKRAAVPDLRESEAKLRAARDGLRALKERGAGQAELRRAESFLEGAEINLLKAQYRDPPSVPVHSAGETAAGKGSLHDMIPVEAGILTIQNRTVLCSPFELFSTLAVPLKKSHDLEMFGYINALEGYLADKDAYENMDYEALSSPFAKGEGEHYIELVSRMIVQ